LQVKNNLNTLLLLSQQPLAKPTLGA